MQPPGAGTAAGSPVRAQPAAGGCPVCGAACFCDAPQHGPAAACLLCWRTPCLVTQGQRCSAHAQRQSARQVHLCRRPLTRPLPARRRLRRRGPPQSSTLSRAWSSSWRGAPLAGTWLPRSQLPAPASAAAFPGLVPSALRQMSGRLPHRDSSPQQPPSCCACVRMTLAEQRPPACSLAARVTGLGDTIRSAWDKAGAAVGGTVLRIGYAIHQLL